MIVFDFCLLFFFLTELVFELFRFFFELVGFVQMVGILELVWIVLLVFVLNGFKSFWGDFEFFFKFVRCFVF